jgi:DNA primase small subunit
MDIGAVFTLPPRDHATVKQGAFKPVERELVFDIDLTDYDDVRTCCSGANICPKCWGYMAMAMK